MTGADGYACRVCGNAAGNRPVIVPEMMFGTREEFPYYECGACGCLQIAAIPDDMSRYYPKGYYSFDPRPPRTGARPALSKAIKRFRLRSALGSDAPWAARWLAERMPPPFWVRDWMRAAGVGADSRILEAGCGSGALLLQLAAEGFTRLTGVDPFVERDIRYPGGPEIRKARLQDMRGEWDFAMMHHAFEHVPDPEETLANLRRLLAPGKRLLLRVPIAAAAWKEYGKDWVQLDAPRHLFLHTEKSLGLLAGRAGFRVAEVRFDSDEFQFWGSEQYRKGIPLRDPRSHAEGGEARVPEEVLAGYRERARAWNARNQGDQACFFLERT